MHIPVPVRYVFSYHDKLPPVESIRTEHVTPHSFRAPRNPRGSAPRQKHGTVDGWTRLVAPPLALSHSLSVTEAATQSRHLPRRGRIRHQFARRVPVRNPISLDLRVDCSLMNFPFSTFWPSPALAVPLQHTQQIWYPTHGPLHAPPRFSPSKPRTKRRHADSAPHDGQGAGAGTVDSSKAARPEARALYFDPPTPVAAPAAIAAPAMEEEELPAAEDLFAHVTFEPPQVAVELADLANQGKDMIREYLIKWYRYGLTRLCTESNDLWSKGGEPVPLSA